MLRWMRLGLLAAVALPLSGCTPQPPPLDFSPDGQSLVMHGGKNDQLVNVRLDGKGSHVLPGTRKGTFPRWSPQGDRVLYQGEVGLSLYDVLQRRSSLLGHEGEVPYAWSPDGSQVVAVTRPENEPNALVWYSVPEGKLLHRLPLPEQHVPLLSTLSWLPGERGVVLIAQDSRGQNLYVAREGQLRPFTRSGDVVSFTVSGEQLVWARVSSAGKVSSLTLFGAGLDGGPAARLPFTPELTARERSAELVHLAFSPDGERLGLVTATESGFSVRTSDLKGRNLRRLHTVTVTRKERKENSVVPPGVYWTPDSTRLAVLDAKRVPYLRIYDVADGTASQLRLPVEAAAPDSRKVQRKSRARRSTR